MLPKSHPYWHVASVLSRYRRSDVWVRFHLYQYENGRELLQEDRSFSIGQFLGKTVQKFIASVPKNWEAGFRSDVGMGGMPDLHLPMIDFHVSAEHPDLTVFRSPSSDLDLSEFAFYRSGSSFHAYGNRLITEAEWSVFLGKALLLNKPAPALPLTDTRWIGHRLRTGWGALRWTCNQPRYRQLPTRCENPFGA